MERLSAIQTKPSNEDELILDEIEFAKKINRYLSKKAKKEYWEKVKEPWEREIPKDETFPNMYEFFEDKDRFVEIKNLSSQIIVWGKILKLSEKVLTHRETDHCKLDKKPPMKLVFFNKSNRPFGYCELDVSTGHKGRMELRAVGISPLDKEFFREYDPGFIDVKTLGKSLTAEEKASPGPKELFEKVGKPGYLYLHTGPDQGFSKEEYGFITVYHNRVGNDRLRGPVGKDSGLWAKVVSFEVPDHLNPSSRRRNARATVAIFDNRGEMLGIIPYKEVTDFNLENLASAVIKGRESYASGDELTFPLNFHLRVYLNSEKGIKSSVIDPSIMEKIAGLCEDFQRDYQEEIPYLLNQLGLSRVRVDLQTQLGLYHIKREFEEKNQGDFYKEVVPRLKNFVLTTNSIYKEWGSRMTIIALAPYIKDFDVFKILETAEKDDKGGRAVSLYDNVDSPEFFVGTPTEFIGSSARKVLFFGEHIAKTAYNFFVKEEDVKLLISIEEFRNFLFEENLSLILEMFELVSKDPDYFGEKGSIRKFFRRRKSVFFRAIFRTLKTKMRSAEKAVFELMGKAGVFVKNPEEDIGLPISVEELIDFVTNERVRGRTETQRLASKEALGNSDFIRELEKSLGEDMDKQKLYIRLRRRVLDVEGIELEASTPAAFLRFEQIAKGRLYAGALTVEGGLQKSGISTDFAVGAIEEEGQENQIETIARINQRVMPFYVRGKDGLNFSIDGYIENHSGHEHYSLVRPKESARGYKYKNMSLEEMTKIEKSQREEDPIDLAKKGENPIIVKGGDETQGDREKLDEVLKNILPTKGKNRETISNPVSNTYHCVQYTEDNPCWAVLEKVDEEVGLVS